MGPLSNFPNMVKSTSNLTSTLSIRKATEPGGFVKELQCDMANEHTSHGPLQQGVLGGVEIRKTG